MSGRSICLLFNLSLALYFTLSLYILCLCISSRIFVCWAALIFVFRSISALSLSMLFFSIRIFARYLYQLFSPISDYVSPCSCSFLCPFLCLLFYVSFSTFSVYLLSYHVCFLYLYYAFSLPFSLSLIAIFFSTCQYLRFVLLIYRPKNGILNVHKHIFLECEQNKWKKACDVFSKKIALTKKQTK